MPFRLTCVVLSMLSCASLLEAPGQTRILIQTKLGPRLYLFKKTVLPALLNHGVIRRTEYRGSGCQQRYELNFPIELILQAEDQQSTAPQELITFWNDLRKGKV